MIAALSVIEEDVSKKSLEEVISLIREDSDNHFLAVSLNDSNIVSYSKHSSNKKNESKRVKTTLGRYIIRNYEPQYISNHELNLYTTEVLKLISSTQELDSKIVVVSGEEIIDFYATNDDSKEYSGMHSCMTGASSTYTKLYALNSTKVSLVTYGNRARALLWTTDDGTKVLDRYYPAGSKYGELIRQWAENKGYVIRSNHDKLVEKGNVELSDGKSHLISLKHEDYTFPYLDTFKFGKLNFKHEDDNVILCNYENFGNSIFTSIEGSYLISNCERCHKDVEGPDRMIHGYVYCKPCFNIIFFTCYKCSLIQVKNYGKTINDKCFCFNCFNDNYFTCYCCCGNYENCHKVQVNNINYCKKCAETLDIKKCEKCECNFTENYMCKVYDNNNNIKYYCNYDVEEHKYCNNCDNYYSYDLINDRCKNCKPQLYVQYFKDLKPVPDSCSLIALPPDKALTNHVLADNRDLITTITANIAI